MFLRRDMPEKGAFFLRSGNLPLLAFGRASSEIHHESKHKHIPNTMTKKFLVWSKKYASEAEIPPTISTGELIQARGWFRNRMATLLMVGTLVSCIFIARSAKKDVHMGHNVTRDNLEWHESMGNRKLEGQHVEAVIKNERD